MFSNWPNIGKAISGSLTSSLKGVDFSCLEILDTALKQTFAQIPDFSKMEQVQGDAAEALAKRGWFISPWHSGLDLHPRMLHFINSGNWQAGQSELEAHFESILDGIETSIIGDYRHRAEILKEAFALHRENRFLASIPLLLTQSDGIGNETFEISPNSRKNIPLLRRWLDERIRQPDITTRFWRGIHALLPLTEQTTKLDESAHHLNRHAVLHGLSTDYGTRTNSLKAISWLEFISGFSMFRDEAVLGIESSTESAC